MSSAKPPRTKAVAPAAAPPTYRPSTTLYTVIFAALSLAGTYLMRVEPVLNDVPVNFEAQVRAARFDNGTPLVTRYTGVAALDDAFRFLVVAFLAGPAGWDRGVRLQQIHFFVNFFPVVCIWNVEACRGRNRGRLISFTALFALFYQTVGAAVIMPLYYLAYTQSSSADSYHHSGRSVPLSQAKTLLAAAVLGYLVPTAALYLPYGGDDGVETKQYLTMLWQGAPAYVNVLMFVLSSVLASTSVTTTGAAPDGNADVPYLKLTYLVAGLVSAAAHLCTLYLCVASHDPQLTLSYVFVPSKSLWRASTTVGLHYIFQWDWWGCFVPSLVWCYLCVCDILRLQLGEGRPSTYERVISAVNLTWMAALLGPGAVVAMVFHYRESRLAVIEEGAKGTARKPKAA